MLQTKKSISGGKNPLYYFVAFLYWCVFSCVKCKCVYACLSFTLNRQHDKCNRVYGYYGYYITFII